MPMLPMSAPVWVSSQSIIAVRSIMSLSAIYVDQAVRATPAPGTVAEHLIAFWQTGRPGT